MFTLIAAVPVLFATAALAQVPEAQDPDGWRAAKWGMTEAEVLSAFPGEVERLKKPERLVNGPNCTLGIPTYRIQSMEYGVMFGFDEQGGLSLVRIAPSDEGVPHLAAFGVLENLLTEKYGKPTSTKDDVGRSRMWRLPRTVVSLTYLSFPQIGKSKAFDVLTLSYTPPSKEADKL